MTASVPPGPAGLLSAGSASARDIEATPETGGPSGWESTHPSDLGQLLYLEQVFSETYFG